MQIVGKPTRRYAPGVRIDDGSHRDASLGRVRQLRQAGLTTEYPLLKAKQEKQFKRALELKAKWLVTLVNANQVHVKNLGTRKELIVPLIEVASALQD